MRKTSLLLLFVFGVSLLFAQKKELSLENAILYQELRPERIPGFQWIERSNAWSVIEEGKLVRKIDHPNRQDWAITPEEIMPGLTEVPNVTWAGSGYFYFQHNHQYFGYSIENAKLYELAAYPKEAKNLDYSRLNKHVAYTIDHNLYVANSDNSQIPVTQNKSPNIVSGQAIARYEFGISKGTFWSPRGKLLAYYQKDETDVTDYPLVDYTTTPASLHNVKYPMNGAKSEKASAWVYSLETGKSIRLQTTQDDHYITNLSWSPDEMFVYLAEVNRDQNHLKLNKYDSYSGKFLETIFEEKNDKWVEPEHPIYFMRHVPNYFVWLSEKDGYMNLYRYDEVRKEVKQLTKNQWVFKSIIGFSPFLQSVVLSGTGENPLNTHAFAVNYKTGELKQLTKGDGTHRVTLGGMNNEYIIDDFTSTTVTKEISFTNLKTDTKKVLLNAENPLDKFAVGKTDIIELKSYDGTALYGRMIKPHDFTPTKKYPVLVYVYGGPHVQLVSNRWMTGAPAWMHWMANQGYLIFTVDGHGSSNRGFAFESEVFRNLGKYELKDQLIGVDYLKTLSYVDTERLAIHGWSFGGYMTTSMMLKHPEVFKVGVGGGPVIDWTWYEIMYGERYMDTRETNPTGFKETNLRNYVENLSGKLLLIHGMSDDVVVPQHNLSFVKTCVDEGVQVDFFPYPGHPHNVRGKDRIHLMRKVLDYIITNN